MKKYEILKENFIVDKSGSVVFRIRALKEFCLSDGTVVKKGTIGGYIQSESNLSHFDSCWVSDNAVVCNNAIVCDKAIVKDEVRIRDCVYVGDNSVIEKNCIICDKVSVLDNSFISGNVVIGGDTLIRKKSKIKGYVRIVDCEITNSTITEKAHIFGGSVGDSLITDTVKINGRVLVKKSNISNNAKIHGDIFIEESTISDSVTIDSSTIFFSIIKNSILRDNTRVSGYFNIIDSLLIKDSNIKKDIFGNILPTCNKPINIAKCVSEKKEDIGIIPIIAPVNTISEPYLVKYPEKNGGKSEFVSKAFGRNDISGLEIFVKKSGANINISDNCLRSLVSYLSRSHLFVIANNSFAKLRLNIHKYLDSNELRFSIETNTKNNMSFLRIVLLSILLWANENEEYLCKKYDTEFEDSIPKPFSLFIKNIYDNCNIDIKNSKIRNSDDLFFVNDDILNELLPDIDSQTKKHLKKYLLSVPGCVKIPKTSELWNTI